MARAKHVLFVLCGFASLANAALIENFDDVSALSGVGWVIVNNSSLSSPTPTSWFQGDAFTAHSGAATSYAAANFNSADFGGNTSTWLITPQTLLSDGQTVTFYSRTNSNPALFPDRLELRVSLGAGTDVGATAASVGTFTSLLLSINPTLTTTDYPADWTLYSVNLSGIGAPQQGRLAFRYFVTDTASNGDYVGVDTFSLSDGGASGVPEPGSIGLMLSGLGAGFVLVRHRSKK